MIKCVQCGAESGGKRYCGPKCKQRAYRKRNAPVTDVTERVTDPLPGNAPGDTAHMKVHLGFLSGWEAILTTEQRP